MNWIALQEEQVALIWRDEAGNPVPNGRFKTPEQGAATRTLAAFSPVLDGLGGVCLQDCDIAEISDDCVSPHAVDPEQAERLWAWSSELTGVDGLRWERRRARGVSRPPGTLVSEALAESRPFGVRVYRRGRSSVKHCRG